MTPDEIIVALEEVLEPWTKSDDYTRDEIPEIVGWLLYELDETTSKLIRLRDLLDEGADYEV